MRSHASARVSSQYGCCSRVSFGVALSTCTCTRADVVPFCVARRISVSVSKFIVLKMYHDPQVALSSEQTILPRRESPLSTADATTSRFHAPMFLKRLECSACGLEHEWSRLQNLCGSCNKPLFAIVDLAAASRILTRETLLAREKSLWRYREVLPLPPDVEPVSLGEGGTPLLRASRARGTDDVDLWIKDESLNPTQSFKAR